MAQQSQAHLAHGRREMKYAFKQRKRLSCAASNAATQIQLLYAGVCNGNDDCTGKNPVAH